MPAAANTYERLHPGVPVALMQTLAMGKLVRDGIPDIIRRSGGTPTVKILEGSAYTVALFAKLQEEATEASTAGADHLGEELADCLEVLRAIAAAAGVAWHIVEGTAEHKRAERGGFARRLWLQ